MDREQLAKHRPPHQRRKSYTLQIDQLPHSCVQFPKELVIFDCLISKPYLTDQDSIDTISRQLIKSLVW